MASLDLARRRLLAQRVTGTPFASPRDAVASLGAVQAQDYLGGLWAVGLRTRGATQADVERAVAERSIVRTWPMRGTLHFVAAEDARWMLELLAPRAMARSALRLRQLALDEATFARSRKVLGQALRDGRRLPRDEVYRVLRAARISTAGQRGIHILQRLALERFLCFAARQGKQHTFALFEEWVGPGRSLPRNEALAELAVRYFGGHGPATLQDFAWWSGLDAAGAREALALAGRRLSREVAGDRVLWRADSPPAGKRGMAAAYLLPPFDESLVGYRDRTPMLDPADAARVRHLLSPTIVVGGRVVGTWTRSLDGDSVLVRASIFDGGGRRPGAALAAAAERYGRFLGRRAVLA